MANFLIFVTLFTAACMVNFSSSCTLCGNNYGYYGPYVAPGGCGLGYGGYGSYGSYGGYEGCGLGYRKGLGYGKCGLGCGKYGGYNQACCLPGPCGLPPVEGCCLDGVKVCLAQKLLCLKRKLLAKKLGVCGNLFV